MLDGHPLYSISLFLSVTYHVFCSCVRHTLRHAYDITHLQKYATYQNMQYRKVTKTLGAFRLANIMLHMQRVYAPHIPDVPKKTGIPKSDLENKNVLKLFEIQINMQICNCIAVCHGMSIQT